MKATMQTSVKATCYVKKGNELGDRDIYTFHDNIANYLFWLPWGLVYDKIRFFIIGYMHQVTMYKYIHTLLSYY